MQGSAPIDCELRPLIKDNEPLFAVVVKVRSNSGRLAEMTLR